MPDLKKALLKLENKKSLTSAEMAEAMEAIVGGGVPDAEIEAFLLNLRQKGETAQEIAAAARIMRAHAVKLSKSYPDLLDTCGTGGDGSSTVNVSTLAAIIASAAGVRVAKHGNRSVSSQCGSADLLEMLGIKISQPIRAIENSLDKAGFAFFFAPDFHPATRFAMPARKKIQGKTIFNLLGPLSNPAGASLQLIGVYDEKWVEIVAEVAAELGVRRALVVHSKDGLDEISITAGTFVAELENGTIKTYTVTPSQFGIKPSALPAIQFRTKEECKEAALKVLKGEKGAAREVVCLNAGAALYVAGKAGSLAGGFFKAKETVDNGAAHHKLEEIVSLNKS